GSVLRAVVPRVLVGALRRGVRGGTVVRGGAGRRLLGLGEDARQGGADVVLGRRCGVPGRDEPGRVVELLRGGHEVWVGPQGVAGLLAALPLEVGPQRRGLTD